MSRRIYEVPPSAADVKLDHMTAEALRALLRTVPGAAVAGLTHMDVDRLQRAARTYIRIGRLTEAQVLQFKMEIKA